LFWILENLCCRIVVIVSQQGPSDRSYETGVPAPRVGLFFAYHSTVDGHKWSINLLTIKIQDELTIIELDSVNVSQVKIVVVTVAERYFANHPYYVIGQRFLRH
jgi:hypothetical protein